VKHRVYSVDTQMCLHRPMCIGLTGTSALCYNTPALYRLVMCAYDTNCITNEIVFCFLQLTLLWRLFMHKNPVNIWKQHYVVNIMLCNWASLDYTNSYFRAIFCICSRQVLILGGEK